MERQRIDKWLWHVRLVRTRTAAADLADSGRVRVNGDRVVAASKSVRPGDVITVMLDRVRVLKVLSFSERRGSAAMAAELYEDLAPSARTSDPPDGTSPPARENAGSRPTKRERRAIVRLKRALDT